MNLSVDPCVDFYEYACGGWIKNNPVSSSQSHVNQFQLAEDKLYANIKAILEKDNPNDLLPVRAASLFYKACTNADRIEVESKSQLIKLLESYGNWPMTIQNWNAKKFDWLQMSTDAIKRFSVMSLMYIYVGRDRLNSNQSVILIDQPTLVLPRPMLTEPQTYKVHLEAYKQWIAATAVTISKYQNQNISISSIEKEANDVLQFEINIAKLTSSNIMRKNAFRMYNNMTLRNLQEWTDLANSAITCRIDWLAIMRNLFSGTPFAMDYNERVVVKELDFFFNFANLLCNTPARVLANYMHWRLVRTFSQDSTDEIRILASQFDQVFSGIMQSEPRWKDCLATVANTLNFAVGYAYVKEYFDEETKIVAKEMVDNILEEFSHQLQNAKWMDEPTKLSALLKVKNMVLFVGYPDWYKNSSALYAFYDGLSVGPNHIENIEQVRTFLYKQALRKLRQKTDRHEWVAGPAIVNAFNDGNTNSIILPAGILQPPFFDTKRIMSMNYGSIGAVIGHEILHSFDDTGRLTDKYGNLAQWWSEDVIVTYENKTQCFIDQYSKFVVPIAASFNQTTIYSVNGMFTQGENIADNSGLRQAFFAYKKHARENGEEKPIQRIEQFTPEQLFFISYAMAWCESNTKESLMQEILNDPHSPHKIRVTGTLSNSPEFAATFKCSPNSPMNPQQKCIIW
ncbi:neprilysin-4-like isoform X2 [Planococcus citri]